MSTGTVINAEAEEVKEDSPKVEETPETKKVKALGRKASFALNIRRGLKMVKDGASSVLKSARQFARHFLVKILLVLLLAALLVGFAWLLFWVGAAALAVSGWLLAAFIFFTWPIDLGIIIGLIQGMMVVVTDMKVAE